MKQINTSNTSLLFLVASLLAVGTFVLYLPSLGYGFVNWDDPIYITENPFIASFRWSEFWTLFGQTNTMSWNPLVMLSFVLDYTAWGTDPYGYHLSNNVLHALNTALVFGLSILLIQRANVSHASVTSPITLLLAAGFSALIFAVHPQRVESVAWITERKDLLYAFFYLLAMISYLFFVNGIGKSRAIWYGLTCLLFAASLLSKTMAVTLPVILLILDVYPLRRVQDWASFRQTVLQKLPLFLLAIAAAAITLSVQSGSGAVKSLEQVGLVERLMTVIYAYVFYLEKLFFPFGLAPFYPHPGLTKLEISTALYALNIATFVLISAAAFWQWRKRAYLLPCSWLLYLAMLFPVSGIIHIGGHFAADRFTYLPLVPIGLLIAFALVQAMAKTVKKPLAGLLPVLVLAVLMVAQTREQMSIWQDSGKLWNHVIALYPEADALPYYNRGQWYEKQSNFQAAIADYSKAIDINGNHVDALENRGILYAEQGRMDKSLADFNRSIEVNPGRSNAYLNRGTLYHRLGNLGQAAADYRKVLSIDPENRVARYNLSLIMRQGAPQTRSQ